MADDKVTVSFEVTGDAAKKMQEIASGAKDVNDSFKKNFGAASGAFETFKGVLAAEAVVKGLELVKDAALELFDLFVKDGVKAAIAEENAIATLNGTLAANGNYSKQASKDIVELADALESVTKFGNETVVAAAGLIEGLSKLDSQGLKVATRGAADLAALFNTDLNTSASAIGRAFEGSTRGLKQFGIEIIATTDKAQLGRQILSALQARQGLAELQSNTYAGATAKLGNAFDNMVKQVGLAIIQNPQLVAVIKAASSAFNSLEKSLKDNKDGMSDLLSEGIDLFLSAVPIGITVIAGFSKVLLTLKSDFLLLESGIYSAVIAVSNVQLALAKVVGTAENIRVIEERLKGLHEAQDEVNKSGEDNQKVFESVGARAIEASEKVATFRETIANAEDGSAALTAKLKELSDGVVKLTDSQRENIEQGVALSDQLTTKQAQAEAELALLTAKHENELISDADFYAQKQAIQDQAISDQQVKVTAAYASGNISQEKFNSASLALDNKKYAQDLANKRDADAKKLKDQQNFLSLAATLQSAKSKELQVIGKAAAITSIAIQTPDAIMGAYRFGNVTAGPVLGAVLAAIAATASASLAAQAAGVPLMTGIDSVPGPSNRDHFSAMLAGGERVVPTTTNRDLTSFLSGSSGMTQLLQSIDNKLTNLQNQTIVNIGAKNIVNELRDAMAGGRVINV